MLTVLDFRFWVLDWRGERQLWIWDFGAPQKPGSFGICDFLIPDTCFLRASAMKMTVPKALWTAAAKLPLLLRLLLLPLLRK